MAGRKRLAMTKGTMAHNDGEGSNDRERGDGKWEGLPRCACNDRKEKARDDGRGSNDGEEGNDGEGGSSFPQMSSIGYNSKR